MFLRSTYPALLWALLILGLCAIPGQRIPHIRFLDWLKPDKVVHLFLFGILSFLLIRGFLQQTSIPFLFRYSKSVSIFLSIVYGIVIELLQEYYFSKRSGEVFDAVADALGAFIGLWFFNLVMKRRLAKKNY